MLAQILHFDLSQKAEKRTYLPTSKSFFFSGQPHTSAVPMWCTAKGPETHPNFPNQKININLHNLYNIYQYVYEKILACFDFFLAWISLPPPGHILTNALVLDVSYIFHYVLLYVRLFVIVSLFVSLYPVVAPCPQLRLKPPISPSAILLGYPRYPSYLCQFSPNQTAVSMGLFCFLLVLFLYSYIF